MCFFSKILKYIPDSGLSRFLKYIPDSGLSRSSLGVSLCTTDFMRWTPDGRSNTKHRSRNGRIKKSYFKGKNIIFYEHPVLGTRAVNSQVIILVLLRGTGTVLSSCSERSNFISCSDEQERSEGFQINISCRNEDLIFQLLAELSPPS